MGYSKCILSRYNVRQTEPALTVRRRRMRRPRQPHEGIAHRLPRAPIIHPTLQDPVLRGNRGRCRKCQQRQQDTGYVCTRPPHPTRPGPIHSNWPSRRPAGASRFAAVHHLFRVRGGSQPMRRRTPAAMAVTRIACEQGCTVIALKTSETPFTSRTHPLARSSRQHCQKPA